MKLLVISHTPHYQNSGSLSGWAPTVREIDYLAGLFDEVTHLAPLHQEKAPLSTAPYQSRNIRMRLVPAAGGDRWRDKLAAALAIPAYIKAIRQEMRNADVIHVRCPAGISALAIAMLPFAGSRLRWVKYAGNWKPEEPDAWSYRWQRFWLRYAPHGSVVTVNGSWPGQPAFVHSFLNPCLTEEELQRALLAAREKRLSAPVRTIFVGRLEAEKGAGRVLEIIAALHQRQIPVTIDMIGDGPERPAYEKWVDAQGIRHLVTFHGWLPRTSLAALYAHSHIALLPSSSEGWPKVLSEGMAYGVVPVAANVSSIPQYLKQFSTGKVFAPGDIAGFANAIEFYWQHPTVWRQESAAAVAAAERFSYSSYITAVRHLLGLQSGSREVAVAPSDSTQVMDSVQ